MAGNPGLPARVAVKQVPYDVAERGWEVPDGYILHSATAGVQGVILVFCTPAAVELS